MKRIILGIAVGLAFNFILSTCTDYLLHYTGVFPPYGEPMFETNKVLLALTYRSLFAVMATYIAATIAKANAKKAVLTLGIIGSLLWLAGAIAFWDYTPAYYNIGGIIIGVPLALLGYKLYLTKRNKQVLQ